jgi:uncharacterized membrane protein YoaK (UPF0700 family)
MTMDKKKKIKLNILWITLSAIGIASTLLIDTINEIMNIMDNKWYGMIYILFALICVLSSILILIRLTAYNYKLRMFNKVLILFFAIGVLNAAFIIIDVIFLDASSMRKILEVYSGMI